MGGVRVAWFVRQRVMLAVIADPLGDRPLHRHAAEDREGDLDRDVRAEAAMREVAVEPNRRPEGTDHVEARQEDEVDRVDADPPEEPDRREQSQRRDDHSHERYELADRAAVRPNRANLYGLARHLSPIGHNHRTDFVREANKVRCEYVIVGSGISGLGAAYLLSRAHEVVVFEQASRAGGHTRTVRSEGLSLDMGFLVHNERNYPLLTRLFRELGVATQDSEMSFSVSCTCGLEYSSSHPFAQSRRLADPRHLVLLVEIARWLRTADRSLGEQGSEDWTLQRFLDEHRFSNRFRRHFLVPMTAALWSTAPKRALEYPAAAAIRFFENHGMLGFRRRGWRYVTGGSDSYVRAIADRLGTGLPSDVASARSAAMPAAST